jgi:hypothetical protein
MRLQWSATLAFAPVALAAVVRTASAQNEGALRAAFEGRAITLKVDMPATSQGIDVYPQEAMPVDFREVAQRLKDNGTAIRTGQQVMITKVSVKKAHIEFQLGAGGYGTFGDVVTSRREVSAAGAGETAQERSLLEAIKRASGAEKKRLEREYDALRSARERENSRAAAEAQQANVARDASIRSRGLEAGSRFNIRYKHGFTADATTPAGVVRALAQYADFGALAVGGGGPARAGAPALGAGELRKGMTVAQVEAALGPAVTAAEEPHGSMTITRRTYRPEGMQVTASFVSGVLVDYAITPR